MSRTDSVLDKNHFFNSVWILASLKLWAQHQIWWVFFDLTPIDKIEPVVDTSSEFYGPKQNSQWPSKNDYFKRTRVTFIGIFQTCCLCEKHLAAISVISKHPWYALLVRTTELVRLFIQNRIFDHKVEIQRTYYIYYYDTSWAIEVLPKEQSCHEVGSINQLL